MKLHEYLHDKLAEWAGAADERRTLSGLDSDTGATAHLVVEHVEKLSCKLWEVHVTRPGGEINLADRANKIASDVTGLIEPLTVIEIDAPKGTALIRSANPAQKSGQVFYYELRLRQNGEAHLHRYQGAAPGKPREQVEFVLTHEALIKLVDDLVA